MVELLVVIVVISILLTLAVIAGSAVYENSRAKATAATLTLVNDAIEQFKREAPPVVRKATYRNRYGEYPPDELEMFTDQGVLGRSLAPDGSFVYPAPPPSYANMKFYTDGLPPDELNVEHRDNAALVLTLELFGDASRMILDKVPAKHRSAGALDATSGLPSQFLDRDGNESWDLGTDTQIRYIQDDWGVPISYFSQRDYDAAKPIESSNHPNWKLASTEMIRLNGNHPILVSYGPDGRDQLTQEYMGDNAAATLVGDWTLDTTVGRIDHPTNADNVYVDPDLGRKLAEGAP